ncbi:hypothetical protein [Belnapia moabensis]|nr:hypothetical protein [Belnapia moabensis]
MLVLRNTLEAWWRSAEAIEMVRQMATLLREAKALLRRVSNSR